MAGVVALAIMRLATTLFKMRILLMMGWLPLLSRGSRRAQFASTQPTQAQTRWEAAQAAWQLDSLMLGTKKIGGKKSGFQNSAARQLDLLLPGAGASLLPTAASANAQEASDDIALVSDDIALIVNLRRRKQLRPGEKHPETAPFRRAIVIVLDRSASMRQGGVATALVTTLKGEAFLVFSSFQPLSFATAHAK
ncbi:hypothetical protein T492DRAFT_835982 [Pavlovales sp. CCMP2436]|nr:hypothetical protein T492DRAFT_835982 [Pavlovales sp. CCMP2436]